MGNDKAASFRSLLLMAAADGRMSESELRFLADRATEWGITDEEFEQALQDAMEGRAALTLPANPQERTALLKELIRVMAADGRLSEPEKQLFALASSLIGVDAAELDRLIDAVIAEDDRGC